jgi:hypothetical protein
MPGNDDKPSAAAPDLDRWLPEATLRVAHRRSSTVPADELWEAAGSVRLADTALLGRLVRWRIPGLARDVSFDQLFREPPFIVLAEGEHSLVSGLVGRIWTLRRDYPQLDSPQDFESWSARGTARVVLANWVQPGSDGRAVLASEARVQPLGSQGRVGVAAVRPLVRAFQNLVGSEGIGAAIRRAERGR